MTQAVSITGDYVPRTLLAVRGLEKTNAEFRRALCDMADRLGLDPSFIAAVMSVETDGTFDPAIRNPYTGAVGLIQFMPTTAIGLDTDRTALAEMSAVEQLHFVEKYFRRVKGIRPLYLGDYYMAVFMPAYVGTPAGQLLFVEGSKGFEQNRGLDRDRDGQITVGDVWETVDRVVRRALALPVLAVDPPQGFAEEPTEPEIPITVEEPTDPATPYANDLSGALYPVPALERPEIPPPPAVPWIAEPWSQPPTRATTRGVIAFATALGAIGFVVALVEFFSR